MTTLGHPNPIVELSAAVAAFTGPQYVDDVDEPLPSLLDQLEEAIEPSGGTGSGRANVYKSPAALEVVGLLTEIDRYVKAGLRMSQPRRPLNRPRAELIEAWLAQAGFWKAVHAEYLYASIGQAKRWVVRAKNILTPDPQTIETQAQPCPSCEARTAFEWNPYLEERVQRPSLYLDKVDLVVYCRCCAAQWSAPLWPLLRRVLDAQTEDRLAARKDR